MKRYIRTVESKSSSPTGNVGIWWFYDNTVIGEYCPMYGILDLEKINSLEKDLYDYAITNSNKDN